MARGKLQRNQAAEGEAENGWALQPHPIEELAQVFHKVENAEWATEGETVILAAKLVTDYPKRAAKLLRKGAKQLEATGQTGNENDRRSFANLRILNGVVGQMHATS